MNYYKDNKSPERWALAALAAYFVLLGAAMLFLSVESGVAPAAGEVVLVDYPEPPTDPPAPDPPAEPTPEPRQHDRPAPVEQNDQVRGDDEHTRTVNPKALFRQSKSGPDAPENAGNPQARPADRDEAACRGSALKSDGSDQLDKGLQGRGLAGALPRPDYPGNVAGKVVIRVTVDRGGKVTAAVYEPEGSTTSNADLVEAARRAALKARFTESSSFVQGGTITYLFKLN